MSTFKLISSALRLQTFICKPPPQRNTTVKMEILFRRFSTVGHSAGRRNSEKKPTMTMAEVKEKMRASLGLPLTYSLNPVPRDHLTQYEPTPEDLPPRSMQDSFTSAIIPLSTDLMLRDKYTAFLGRLRLGRLLEDMDLFASWVCHQHIYIPKLDPNVHLPYTFVTILVDRIDFTPISSKVDQDVRISGHISWVGRSSMEIVVWLEQFVDDDWKKITRALFLFAARNATNTKAACVNQLIPGNEEERKILEGGEQRRKRRIQLQEQSLFKVEPNDEEQRLIHTIFMKTIPGDIHAVNESYLPPNSVWLSDTKLSNLILTHPQNRNAHDKIFGGYLMRQALEMAFSCAYMFSKLRPTLENISDIAFRKPVPVSSFINMVAHVLYTEKNYMQIVCVANIHDALTGEQFTTNEFYFTFSVDKQCPAIVPKTYHEAIWFLQGKRKMEYARGHA